MSLLQSINLWMVHFLLIFSREFNDFSWYLPEAFTFFEPLLCVSYFQITKNLRLLEWSSLGCGGSPCFKIYLRFEVDFYLDRDPTNEFLSFISTLFNGFLKVSIMYVTFHNLCKDFICYQSSYRSSHPSFLCFFFTIFILVI